MCRECGFMAYRPRPSDADIDAKYRLLQQEERHIGGQKDDARSRMLDRKRSKRIFSAVTRHTGSRTLDVMDFGGGDGKLLRPFLEAGHRCSLVDYNVAPLAGITKIGDTLDDVPPETTFDVIICSHVIEHLAEPGEQVDVFKGRLRDGGVIYAEVPAGIWGGIGIGKDPVTHVNFFNGHSFARLFATRGLRVLSMDRCVGVYNRRLDVIVVMAVTQPDSAEAKTIEGDGVGETQSLLHPTLGMQLRRRFRLRKFPALKRLLGGS
jgi:SAM-dependent methyltransferase